MRPFWHKLISLWEGPSFLLTATGSSPWQGGDIECPAALIWLFIKMSSQKAREGVWEGRDVMLGGSEYGNIVSFLILTIKLIQPDSSPKSYTGVYGLISSTPSITAQCHPELLRPKEEVTRAHLLPLPPWGKAIKSMTLASRSCYVNRLHWGKKQAVIYKPPSGSSLSPQPGTACSGRTCAHIGAAAQMRGFVLLTLQGRTQDDGIDLDSQPGAFPCSLRAANLEEGGQLSTRRAKLGLWPVFTRKWIETNVYLVLRGVWKEKAVVFEGLEAFLPFFLNGYYSLRGKAGRRKHLCLALPKNEAVPAPPTVWR